MATSGTTGQTVIDVIDLCEHIARRCGVQPNRLTPEHLRVLKNVMFFFMTSLSNRGINLWRVQRGLFGLAEGQGTYTMPSGTLDLIQAHYRTPDRLDATVTASDSTDTGNLVDGDVDTVYTQGSTGGNVQWDFTDKAMVNLVGLLGAGADAMSLIFEASSDASTWSELRTPGSITMADGKWKWFNIEPAKNARYFRIREQSTGTLKFRDAFVCQDWREITMFRMNRDEFGNLPDKRFPGEPRQFWFDRQSPKPEMILWPVPDEGAAFSLVSVFLHMQCQDIGQLSGEVDIPQRWYDAFVANCAFEAILDLPGADLARYPMLKDQAASTMAVAEGEERDNTPLNILPNIEGYTA